MGTSRCHKAIVAGLSLALTFGAVSAPQLREPTQAYAASSLSAVSLSDEMRYFTKYESACNYDQGFSSGDGYNAMGYYQFDRRYSLGSFIEQVYAYNPSKYSMFSSVISRLSELKTGVIYANGSLTELGRLVNNAWHAAYAADSTEFSALQDSYAYNNYYLPVQRILKNNYGVDISDRADCVKGLCWSLCNWLGQGGVCAFFDWAVEDSGLSDDMSDRELVNALCDAVVDHIKNYSSQSQYYNGWISRYGTKERNICLSYIAEDEAAATANNNTNADNNTTNPSTGTGTSTGEGAENASEPAANNGDSTDANTDTTQPDSTSTENTGTSNSNADAAATNTSSGANGSEKSSSVTNTTKESNSTSSAQRDTSNAIQSQSEDSQTAEDTNPENSSTDVQSTASGSEQTLSIQEAGSSLTTQASYSVVFTVKGEAHETLSAASGGTITAPVAPSYKNYSFAGWYLNGALYCQAGDTITVTSDMELIAYYKKDSSQTPTSQPEGLPQTGDSSAIIALAVAGTALAGTSAAVFGLERRRKETHVGA